MTAKSIYTLGLSYLALLCFGVLLSAAYVPAFGWDALDYWLNFDVSLNDGRSKHGDLLPILFSLISYATDHPQLFNMAAFFGVGLVVIQKLKCASHNQMVVLFALIVAVSTPLVENHLHVFGYPEIYLGLTLYALYATLNKLLLNPRSLMLLSLACLLTGLAIYSKNTGVFFSACLIAAFLIQLIRDNSKHSRLLLIFSGFIAVAVCVYQSQQIFVERSDGTILLSQSYCYSGLANGEILELRPELDGRDIVEILKYEDAQFSETDCMFSMPDAIVAVSVFRITSRRNSAGGLASWTTVVSGEAKTIGDPHLFQIVSNDRDIWIGIAGRMLRLSFQNIAEGIDALTHIFFFNQSFSLLVFAFFICLLAKKTKDFDSFALENIATVLLLTGYVLGVLLSPELLSLAAPSKDTSGSRLLIPVLPLLVCVIFKAAGSVGINK